MAFKPNVAAIVPYFEGRRFLAEALESALGQTYPVLEVIVVNDGSPDDFDAAIAPFRSRVRVVEQPHQGVAAARNHGLAATDADCIAFLDQDDVWRENKIERQVGFLADHADCGLVHTSVSYVDADGAPATRTPARIEVRRARGRCTVELLAHNTIAMSSVLLRREALADERFAEGLDGSDDWDLWLRLSQHWAFGFLDEALTFCRLHDRNASLRRDVMVRGRVPVLERALARPAPPEIRAQAWLSLRAALTDLAHLEYEEGNRRAARALFAAGARDRVALVRYLATFLPSPVYSNLRACRRLLRRRRDTGEKRRRLIFRL